MIVSHPKPVNHGIRYLLSSLLLIVSLLVIRPATTQTSNGKPTFIVIFTDDQGYGDRG